MLIGTVPGIRGGLLSSVSYSKVAAKHRLTAWVRLLALAATHQATGYEAVTIGRLRDGGTRAKDVTVARIPNVPQGEALSELAVLVDLYERGLREPLPLYCETSAAYAAAVAAGKNGQTAARTAWASTRFFPREDVQLEHRLVLGGTRAVAELFEETPRADEGDEGWAVEEPTRFGRYARRLWNGLLPREELIDR
jgi:exodeoxyribonuclease V gamma subunit